MGAPSAALTDEGIALAYRVRRSEQRGAAVVVASSVDGVSVHTVATLDKSRFGAESLERPALVRRPDGGWRIYSSGPGMAVSIIVRCLLGVRREGATLVLDPVLPLSLNGLRARMPVAGHEIEVLYRVRAGHGPTALRLNGQPLGFARGTNPLRTGGAVVSFAEFAARCSTTGANRLEIDV